MWPYAGVCVSWWGMHCYNTRAVLHLELGCTLPCNRTLCMHGNTQVSGHTAHICSFVNVRLHVCCQDDGDSQGSEGSGQRVEDRPGAQSAAAQVCL